MPNGNQVLCTYIAIFMLRILVLLAYRRKLSRKSTTSSGRHNNAIGHSTPPPDDYDKYTELQTGVNPASDYSELNLNDNSQYELHNL